MNRNTTPLIAAYLLAIILANLTVALAPPLWRPTVVLINSLTLIGLDLTVGDRLHEAWRGRGLIWRMALLILAGSALSFTLNGAAGPVALCSLVAFALSATSDRLVYTMLDRYGWYARVNGSNAVGALIDSAVFLCGLAVAGLLAWRSVPILVAAQWGMKVAGGGVWALVLRRRVRVEG